MVLKEEIEVFGKAKASMIENRMLKEYGSKARRFVEKYNWDDIVDEFEGVFWRRLFVMNEMYSAYITDVDKYLKENLLKSLEFIEWKNQVKKESTVFVKPNFTFPYYKEGITTTPELLRNLLEIIKDRADNVILGESNGGNHSFSADDAFKGHGMYEICRDTGVELINLSKLPGFIPKLRNNLQ